jgi:Amt family ammonium transporter
MRKSPLSVAALAVIAAVSSPAIAFADGAPPQVNAGDTAFMLIATALVLLMTPGLAFFYGGMVRRKNVLATLMQSFILMGVVGVQWVLLGYSISFAPDPTGVGLFGGFSWAGLIGVGAEPSAVYGPTIPHLVFMMFQGMFAIITPALISGAFAERMKFSGFLVFTLLWSTLVYDPIAHWVWGADGWLNKMGALDFAGGTVVHINSAVAAGAALIFVGKRHGFLSEPILPHNLSLTVLGGGILWFGWFGFNAGSALSAGGQAATAFVATNTGAAAAALTWMFTDWIRHKKPTVLGAVSGAVAGLVAITPACGYVTPLASLAIGAIAGVACSLAVNFRMRLRLDDSLDVLGIHGVGGTIGAVLTGVFCTEEFLKHGNEVFSRGHQIAVQFAGVGATYAYSFVASLILLFVVHKTIGLRVAKEEEIEGLDLSQHGESAYN